MKKNYNINASLRYLSGWITLSLMIAVFLAGTSAAYAQTQISGEAEMFSGSINDYSIGTPTPTITWTIGTVTPTTGEQSDIVIKSATNSQTVSVEAKHPFTGYFELKVAVNGNDDIIIVEVKPNLLAGQVKYYNKSETPMPSPFNTNYSDMVIPDYFWVLLLDEAEWKTWSHAYLLEILNDDIGLLEKVEMKYAENGNPLFSAGSYNSAFAFDGLNLNPDETYRIFVWDGGYVDENAETHGTGSLAQTWTWNNWGGVNATDALLIQHMVVGTDMSGWSHMSHVGPHDATPKYGQFAFNVADVNASGTLSSLDALQTSIRSIGWIEKFPNNKRNFEVAGIFVDGDDFNTNNIFGNELPDIMFKEYLRNLTPVGEATPVFADPTDYKFSALALEHPYVASFEIKTGSPYLNIYYNAVGDINSSYIPAYGDFKELDIELHYNGQVGVDVGQEVTIPVRITRSTEIGALSIGLNYRNDLIEVLGTNYEQDFAFINHDDGEIRIGWFTQDGIYLEQGSEVALITVRILSEIKSGTRLLELNDFTELANRNAQVIFGVDLETVAIATDVVGVEEPAADPLSLTNFPNPFNNSTTIAYQLPEAAKVSLVVYNSMGQAVKTLVNTNQDAGSYEITVTTADLAGPGIYYYRLKATGANNTVATTKNMVLIR